MDILNKIESFVDGLDLDEIVSLATKMGISFAIPETWFDDEYREKEDGLRVKIIDKMSSVFTKETPNA